MAQTPLGPAPVAPAHLAPAHLAPAHLAPAHLAPAHLAPARQAPARQAPGEPATGAGPVEALFAAPPARLGARLHRAVFGELPSLTARALDVPQVAAAVGPLLERGWRPAQLGARVGALPAGDDPVPAVLALCEQLRERESPARVWERERAGPAARRERDDDQPVASEQSRAHWAAQARRSLGLPARTVPATAARPAPACASCGAPAAFFVTRQVRLCAGCVDLLGSGRARLAAGA